MDHCNLGTHDDFSVLMKHLFLFFVLACEAEALIPFGCLNCQSGSVQSDVCLQPRAPFFLDNLQDCLGEHCYVRYNGPKRSITRGCTDGWPSNQRAQCHTLDPSLEKLSVPVASTDVQCWVCGDTHCNIVPVYLTDEVSWNTAYLYGAIGFVLTLIVAGVLGGYCRGRYEKRIRSVNLPEPTIRVIENQQELACSSVTLSGAESEV